jgi:hypothetical protein
MQQRFGGVPFGERGGRWRGVLDVVVGTYPAFLFGGSLGAVLPVFHLHETSRAALTPLLGHLKENGYRTVTADAVARLVRAGVRPAPRTVALTFDDAWASLWTIAAPLLRSFGFTATTFAIPARIAEADAVRPTIEEGAPDDGSVDRSEVPFATWPELRRLQESGTIDVQCHTLSHSMVFCSDRVVGFVTPAYSNESLLGRPLRRANGAFEFVGPAHLGAPLYPCRSRMSDAWRYLPPDGLMDRSMAHVSAHGGPEFFEQPDWRDQLRGLQRGERGRFESSEERAHAIVNELSLGRDALNHRLGTDTVRNLALPWGIAGETARAALGRTGYETAYAERLFHKKIVQAGSDPFFLMRLNAKFIPCLPGRGRRTFFSTV